MPPSSRQRILPLAVLAGLAAVFAALLIPSLQAPQTALNVHTGSNLPADAAVQDEPLVFFAEADGILRMPVASLGLDTGGAPLTLNGELGHNAIDEHLFTPDGAAVASPFRPVALNPGAEVEDGGVLALRTGIHLLDTNAGPLRIVVLRKDASQWEALQQCMAFYLLISIHGRNAERFPKSEIVRNAFRSDLAFGAYCTGHALLFKRLFSSFFNDLRLFNFYGFLGRLPGSRLADRRSALVPAGHTIVEVLCGDRWVVVDPMIGFIPYDQSATRPLSFLQFAQAMNDGAFRLRFFTEVPILPEDRHNDPAPDRDDASRTMNFGHFVGNWDALEVIMPYGHPEKLYMLPETRNHLSDKDFSDYKRHYFQALNGANGAVLDRNHVLTTFREDLYGR